MRYCGKNLIKYIRHVTCAPILDKILFCLEEQCFHDKHLKDFIHCYNENEKKGEKNGGWMFL